ncbi:DUF945 domain-containing protein [Alcaligenaceae bacterium LF4-65]|uniref:DUF945 domain-containing protein n=1 Tax=Zwartia hollandica TaxID=324606 RepID=A0A953ND90_9BURK|nr:DUF945 domain-containing protein [Zwartia hollandica]MBZ1351210.1 DUF945 domain-containing protein [Zwartia hollandica]
MNLLPDPDVLDPYSEEPVQLTSEKVRWRARDATYLAGKWDALSERIPRFVVDDFKATADGPANPHIRTVVRLPASVTEQRIPVGVVSKTYRLAQHADVVEMCLKGIRAHNIDPSVLRCEVGLTPLGEWMNFRAYFPENFSHNPSDGNKLALRLECFNSVDGSSRLVILFGWFRFICTNGLIIGETKASLRDTHDENLNLEVIPEIISEGLAKVKADLARLRQWEQSSIESSTFDVWVDDHLAERWGKKAACRALHICRSGADVELLDPFAGGKPSEKPIKLLNDVPGADERLEWQGHIPGLIENLRDHLKPA